MEKGGAHETIAAREVMLFTIALGWSGTPASVGGRGGKKGGGREGRKREGGRRKRGVCGHLFRIVLLVGVGLNPCEGLEICVLDFFLFEPKGG